MTVARRSESAADSSARSAVLDALATPALVLDEAVLDRDIAAVAAAARERGLALRPHAKTHKSLEIARRQLAAGAVGDVCHRFFDAAGAPVSTALDERVVGISADALRAVPRRIGISGGPSKQEAVRAAVTGGNGR